MIATKFGRTIARFWLAAPVFWVMCVAPASGQTSPSAARYIPRQGLTAYVEFEGLNAHSTAWRKTAAYRMLHETDLGSMLEEVFIQTADSLLKDLPAPRPTGRELFTQLTDSARSGFALGISGKLGAETPSGIAVLKNAPAGLSRLLTTLGKSAGKSEKATREDGRTITTVRVSPKLAWGFWMEKSDLVFVFGDAERLTEAVVETLAAKRLSAADHPIRLELTKRENGFEPVMISFLDLADLPPSPPELGLSGLKRIDSRWGFQGEALVSVFRVAAPAPRKGLLALLDQPTFSVKDGLPIPKGITDFMVVSMDPVKLHDAIGTLVRATNPQAAPMLESVPNAVKQATGLRLREDILAQMGPKMAFYSSGDKVTVPTTPYMSLAQWFLHLPNYNMSVEVKNEAEFLKMLDGLTTVGNRQLKALTQNFGREETVSFRPLNKGGKGFELDVPLGLLPLPTGIRPAITVGNGHAVLGSDLEGARAATASGLVPLEGTLAKSFDGLPERLTMVAASDPSEYLPELLCNLPFFVQAMAMVSAESPASPFKGLSLKIDRDAIPSPTELRKYLFPSSMSMAVDEKGVTIIGRDAFPNISSISAAPVLAALMMPAVGSAREAAKRTQSANNLKQIMLAFHNYHDVNGFFPPPAITDADGKPLLSWRVAILPFLEQNALYQEFHLDEAWDSPHNKKLIERMPNVYGSPNVAPKQAHSTFYQMLVGPGALYEKQGDKGTSLATITDGTSNTIGVVEGGEGAIWSKPGDVKFDPEKPFPKLGGPGFKGGFNAAFCDGSVRFIKFETDQEVLKAIKTKAGGEVVNNGDF